MRQSMSRRGNCLDNASMESFFGHMKDELDYKCCQTFRSLQLVIENYIQDYNYDRYQWTLKKNGSGTIPKPSFKCLIFKGPFIKLPIL